MSTVLRRWVRPLSALSLPLQKPKRKKEETHHVGQDPPGDPDRVDDLRRQLPPAPGAPRVEEPAAARERHAGRVVGQVRVADERHVREQPRGEDAPEAVPGVHGHRVERVVELDLDRDLGRGQVERARDGADDDRGPRPDDVAAGRDRRKAREAAVAHVLDAVHRLARRDLRLDGADDQGGEARGGRGERGGHGRIGDGEVVGRARDRLLRPRVEAVPVFFFFFVFRFRPERFGGGEGGRRRRRGRGRRGRGDGVSGKEEEGRD